MLATITVNHSGDFVDSNPLTTTLREAIAIANADDDPDDIIFSTNPADGLNGGTITLAQVELAISESVTIDASMLSSITIDAGGNGPDEEYTSRIFNISDPSNGSSPPLVTLVGLTLTGGDTSGSGGAIYSNGLLVLDHCVIEANSGGSGGGVFVQLAGGSVGEHARLSA